MPSPKIYAIIVDDEDNCIVNLQYYLSKLCPGIEVIATGRNLAECIANAGNQKFDLAFLDIEIFNETIFESLAKANNVDFEIVFVSAYEQYALKAIKTEAIDYILKPIVEEDILHCYKKITRHFSSVTEPQSDLAPVATNNKKIVLKDADKVYVITMDDIYYMQGNGAYSEIIFKTRDTIKSVTVSKVLTKIEQEYVSELLQRVHKSFIINLSKIEAIVTGSGYHVKMMNGQLIPIAKRRASTFLELLKNLPAK